MSMIKAVDKLRKNLREWVGTDRWETLGTQAKFDALADEIEAEIEERYILLPLDADGVPIRVGDVLESRANGYDGTLTVFSVGNGIVVGDHDIEWIMQNPGKWFHVASFCTHIKPRTLEDVLSDFAVTLTKASDKTNGVAKAVDEYAKEIRELMGVDE